MRKKDKYWNRIKVIKTKYNLQRIFSIRTLINARLEKYFRRGDLRPVDSKGFPKEGFGLAQQLFKVNGVQMVFLDQYDIYIQIGHAFSWDEVEKDIKSKVLSYLQSQILVDDFEDRENN